MIAMTLVGVAFGAALFLLILQVRPPTPDPLVMLARYDQAQAASPRRHGDLRGEDRPPAPRPGWAGGSPASSPAAASPTRRCVRTSR